MSENTLQYAAVQDPAITAASQAGNLRIKLGAAVAAVAVAAAGGYATLNRSGGAEASSVRKDVPEANAVCDDASFATEAGDATLDARAFLPKPDTALDAQDGASTYITKLFKGPLGTKINPLALAAADALIGKPSHDGATTDPNFDYLGTFTEVAKGINAENGIVKAKEACHEVLDTALQDGQYNDAWAQARDQVTIFTPVRNGQNVIIGMHSEVNATHENLKGIEFTRRNTSKNDGYNSVLIDANGVMYVKGATIGTGSSVVENGQSGNTPTENAPSGSEKSNANGGNANANNGGGQFGNTNGNGESNQPGNVPENGGNGGFTPSTNPSFGPGPATTAPGETGTTTPGTTTPETTPTTRQTTTTRPTTTTPPTTTPPTTPPVTKGPPPPCDPNITKC